MRGRGVGLACLILTSNLIASVLASPLCAVARGNDLKPSKSFRVWPAAFVPIGKLYSLSGVLINGRLVRGEEMIFGGELIEVSEDSSALVALDCAGKLVLQRGAILRLATRPANTPAGIRQILVISLASGNIDVQLQEGASAFLEARGTTVATTSGATFRAKILKDEIVVTMLSGDAVLDPYHQDLEYIVEPVIADPLTGRPIKPASSKRTVAPSQGGRLQREQISVRVSKKDKKTKRTIAAGPGRRVTIALLTPGVGELGSQSVSVLTNDYGVATATFIAGPNPGETGIRATDENSGAKWEGRIIVAKPPAFWRTRNKLLFGGGGAVLTTAITIILTRNKENLKQVPPPRIP